jgi:hypothetical protein
MMAQFGKTPPTTLVRRLLALDEEVLGTRDPLAALEGVLQNLPTEDEAKRIQLYEGPLERLGICEAFFMAVLEVPRMHAKLRVFRLKLCMGHSICELQSTLELVSLRCQVTPVRSELTQACTNEGGAAVPSQISACSEEVLASKRLQRAFEIVLELGNLLNQGTMRGAASGFALSSLSKLMDTKSQDGSTLMHYLCKVRRHKRTSSSTKCLPRISPDTLLLHTTMQVLAEKAPHVLSMAEELPSLQRASAVSTPALLEELAHLSGDLRQAQAELRRCEQEAESAPFLSAAGGFVVRTALMTFGNPFVPSTKHPAAALTPDGSGVVVRRMRRTGQREAELRIVHVQERHERATRAAEAMAAHFCEAKTPVEAIARILYTFLQDLNRCALQNQSLPKQ